MPMSSSAPPPPFSGTLLPPAPTSCWCPLGSAPAPAPIPFRWSPSDSVFVSSTGEFRLRPKEILSVRRQSSSDSDDASAASAAHLLLSACPFVDSVQRQLRRFRLRPDASDQLGPLEHALRLWLLRLHLTAPPHRPLADCSRRILVLLNPFSGQRRALELWAREVEPLWREAGIPHETRLTEGPEHATRIAAELDLDRIGTLALGGGDGIVCEAINGLCSRTDRPRALRLPLLHLPMGTGNSLAASIAFQANEPFPARGTFCRQMALMALRPCYRRLRLYQTEFAGGRRRMMFLSLSWGLMADIDLASERFRCLGMARLHLEAFLRIARLPSVARYRARLSYLPMPDGPARRELERKLRFGIQQPRKAFGNGHFSAGEVAANGEGDGTDKDGDDDGGFSEETMPSLCDTVPAGWLSIEAEFCFVLLSTLSHLGSDLPLLPCARPHDPVLYLSFVRWSNLSSRLHMARILLSIDSCGHLADPAYEIIPVLACRIQPAPGMAGLVALDGEAMPNGPGQAFQVVATRWNGTVVGGKSPSGEE